MSFLMMHDPTVFCAYDVDLRKLHKWFLRHPWKRYRRFDEFSLYSHMNLVQYRLFLHRYIKNYTTLVVILCLAVF